MGNTRKAYRATAAVCEHCGQRFEAYRASAKYCCEACKQKAKRKREAQELMDRVETALRDPDPPAGPRNCRSCGEIGIVRDAAGQEVGGGAHVEMTGLCWFCWKITPEGKESMARLGR